MIKIEERYLYELDINDTFFDSLKSDYKNFNEWFKIYNKRKVYVTFSNNKITSFLMLKVEDKNEIYEFNKEFIPKKRLKICTMKIIEKGLGIKDEFIKIIFDKAKELEVKEIYFTVFPKYTHLINFFSNCGFKYYCSKNTLDSKDETKEEYVYVRSL